MSSPTRSIPQMKSIFENYRNALKPTRFRRNKAQDSADADATDMAQDESSNEQSLLDPFPIDTPMIVVDPMAEVKISRPAPNLRHKPSWVGRPAAARPEHSPSSTVTQKVVIRYSAPQLQPPVFITTSLSDPQWEINEMSADQNSDGEWTFRRSFEVEEGEYQYKFRLGIGDWWVCDEDQPTIDDGLGNRNNVLTVPQPTPETADGNVAPLAESFPTNIERSRSDSGVVPVAENHDNEELPSIKPESTGSNQVTDLPEGITSTNLTSATASELPAPGPENYDEEGAPLFRHESSFPMEGDEISIAPGVADHEDERPLLFKHESTFPGQIDDVPEGTIFSSSPNSPVNSLTQLDQVSAVTQSSDEEHSNADKPSGAAVIKRQSSGTSSLPKVQEEGEDADLKEELFMWISEDECDLDPSGGMDVAGVAEHVDKHTHGKVHTGHHHSAIAENDMGIERKLNEARTPARARSTLANVGELVFGAVFAVAIGILAFVLHSTGMLDHQDAAEDGRVALGS